MAQSKKRTLLLCPLILSGFLASLYILNQKNDIQNNMQQNVFDGKAVLISSEQTSSKAIPSPQELARLPRDGGPKYNRLVFEKSPYLLQHATNPVNWYPWGEEAFQKAKLENKPIFLSIGYATCHWCHVMEKESFENDDVAAVLNKNFIAVKVDREERPDIDSIYMSVCQAMTGSGGWPLTIVMTPDRKPFFAGTYFPKEDGFGRPGLMTILEKLSSAWVHEQDKINKSTQQIEKYLQQQSDIPPGDSLTESDLQKTYLQLASRFDSQQGGFGTTPKFPSPHNLSFLLRWWKHSGDAKALQMVEKTLTQMAQGGIYDQLGGGFHRYSTDQNWLVPHFEKMLYDQAMLIMAYTQAYQVTQNPLYAQIVEGTVAYLFRDMTAPEKAFYSAEDADSEGVEGKFYVWQPSEIKKILGDERGEQFCKFYDVSSSGNFQEPHGPENTSILHIQTPAKDYARENKLNLKTFLQELEQDKKRLLQVRSKRIRPSLDDKILTDWNGLMIAALSQAGRALNKPAYIHAASQAADFLLKTMKNKEGRLLHRYRDQEAGIDAHLDDYVFLVWGLIDLYESTFEIKYLNDAIKLNDQTLNLFWDKDQGGLYLTANDAEKLIIRPKEIYDGAYPSGNSVAALNFLRLSKITGRTDLVQKADQLMKAFSLQVSQAPSAHAQLMIALDFAVNQSQEIVIAGDLEKSDTQKMLREINKRFLPNTVVVHHPLDPAKAKQIQSLCSYIENQVSIKGQATAYVCENFSCQAPTTDVKTLIQSLSNSQK